MKKFLIPVLFLVVVILSGCGNKQEMTQNTTETQILEDVQNTVVDTPSETENIMVEETTISK